MKYDKFEYKGNDNYPSLKVNFMYKKDDIKIINNIINIHNEGRIKMAKIEIYQLILNLKRTSRIKGDIIELGVGEGGSAKIINKYKNKRKTLHLFDSFEGLPKPNKIDIQIDKKQNNGIYYKGQYLTSFEDTYKYLKNNKNIIFYKGLIQNKLFEIKNKKFSFAHIDLDLYSSTIYALNIIYPLMNKNGIILIHDYNWAKGCKKAVNKFCLKNNIQLIELIGSQALIIKNW